MPVSQRMLVRAQRLRYNWMFPTKCRSQESTPMPRIVRCSLIQAANVEAVDQPLEKVKQAMIAKHLPYIRQAAEAGAQIICLQEIFYGPYFCAEQQTRWYDFTEPIPDGPTIKLMQDLSR